MLVAFLVATTIALPLNLDLSCPGQYNETENSTTYQDAYGRPLNQPLSLNTNVEHHGVARIALHGDEGRIVYPDGRERTLKLVSQDDETIIAQYDRPILFIHATWRVKISRVTGEVRVIGGVLGRQTAFEGICVPVSTDRKF